MSRVPIVHTTRYGAGWSTWNLDYPQSATDEEIARLVEAKADADIIRTVAQQKWPDGFWHSADHLGVAWLESGTRYLLVEHDGCESLYFEEDLKTA